MRAANHENLGNPMVFETCEFIREELANINDAVVDKFNGIMKAEEQKRIEEATPKISDTNFLDYTPVNKETFGAWCKNFLEEMKQLEDAEKTEQDLRKTGREIFMEKAGGIEDLVIDDDLLEGEDDQEEVVEDITNLEEQKVDEGADNENEGALYDKNLFAAELGEDLDDIDFD